MGRLATGKKGCLEATTKKSVKNLRIGLEQDCEIAGDGRENGAQEGYPFERGGEGSDGLDGVGNKQAATR